MTDPARAVFGDSYQSISSYVDILASDGVEWGLIGPREVDRLWSRHILNSVALSELIPEGSTVIDVGSGAGLPGIPLAILRPDLVIALLEPLLRRFNFLTHSVNNLGITNVSVIRARAEDHTIRYDVVTARAVAPLPRLLTWCAPLMTSDGVLLALKGERAESELEETAAELQRRRLTGEVLQVRAHPDAESTSVVRIRRQRY